MSRYLLVPAQGSQMDVKEILIPKGMAVDPYAHLFGLVKNKDKLQKLLLNLNKFNISEDKESGFVKHGETLLTNVVFKDVVVDSCNEKFLGSYEPFYKLLKRFGIVF